MMTNIEEMEEITESSEDSGSSPSFEESMRELEELVSALEEGQIPLEKSVQLVQRGLLLAKRCEKILNAAELTLTQLTASSEGELIEEPIDWESSEG